MSDHLWIDEVDLSYWEPTADPLLEVFKGFAMSSSWVEAESKNQARKTYERLKRQKEMEHCLHGSRPYPINWAPGTHPLGPREYWVNIPEMTGGPYLLSEEDHKIFHDGRFPHDHVTTTEIRNARNRRSSQVPAS